MAHICVLPNSWVRAGATVLGWYSPQRAPAHARSYSCSWLGSLLLLNTKICQLMLSSGKLRSKRQSVAFAKSGKFSGLASVDWLIDCHPNIAVIKPVGPSVLQQLVSQCKAAVETVIVKFHHSYWSQSSKSLKIFHIVFKSFIFLKSGWLEISGKIKDSK